MAHWTGRGFAHVYDDPWHETLLLFAGREEVTRIDGLSQELRDLQTFGYLVNHAMNAPQLLERRKRELERQLWQGHDTMSEEQVLSFHADLTRPRDIQ